MMSLWSALDDGIITGEQAREIAIEAHERSNTHRARWINHIKNRLTYERAMQQEAGGTVSDRKGPEKGGACRCWASPRDGWSYIQKVNKVTVTVLDNWGNGGGNFTRTISFDQLKSIMTLAEVETARANGALIGDQKGTGFFLVSERPDAEKLAAETHDEKNARLHVEHLEATEKKEQKQDIEAMKGTLRAGIKTIVAPQLFPTPPEIAERMVELAEIEAGQSVLEPSAGTGNIIMAIRKSMVDGISGRCAITAVEINSFLCDRLMNIDCLGKDFVHCADFLSSNGNLGTFDRIIMNPPFENGVDIKHINRARTMLNPGGRLVALCANGPRQREAFKDIADYWEDLPEGSFKNQGTNVNVAIFTLEN
jgi:protein-L-isoaspartate O-methyltransferase